MVLLPLLGVQMPLSHTPKRWFPMSLSHQDPTQHSLQELPIGIPKSLSNQSLFLVCHKLHFPINFHLNIGVPLLTSSWTNMLVKLSKCHPHTEVLSLTDMSIQVVA